MCKPKDNVDLEVVPQDGEKVFFQQVNAVFDGRKGRFVFAYDSNAGKSRNDDPKWQYDGDGKAYCEDEKANPRKGAFVFRASSPLIEGAEAKKSVEAQEPCGDEH